MSISMNTKTLIKRLRDAGLVSKFRGVYNNAVACSDEARDESARHREGIESAQLFVGDTLGVWPSVEVVDNALSYLGT